ncbi:MAG: GAF and ANTAR domain-containing protein [Actinobacteria bacterium]|nr:GAF and ANTAR domain-containing protein [Actinomycetota bacterium]
MPGERRLRILARLTGGTSGAETSRLCRVCADITGMSGAGIMLMSEAGPRGSLCTTDEVSALIEQLQYDLGEGPCLDAYRLDRPVLEPDIRRPVVPRWLAFSGPALGAGARAVFGFPLRVGSVRFGALNLFRDRPGTLDADQHADALVMADVAAQSILLLQAGAPPGQVAAELEAGADFQYVVHQAAGMVAAQIDVSVGEALVRLHAHAFSHDRPLTDVARDVVGRVTRFDESDGATGSPG